MARARKASEVTLPADAGVKWDTVLDFLSERFPLIGNDIWKNRIERGLVNWFDGETVDLQSSCKAGRRLCYFREVEKEPEIPFKHTILHQTPHLVVACKPHFLPVTPGGRFVNECLLERLRNELKLSDIAPLHRLDKDTAGLVIFSTNAKSRPLYYKLFADKKMIKQYHAVAELNAEQPITGNITPNEWRVKSCIVKSQPTFLRQEISGAVNSQSHIKLMKTKGRLGFFQLSPITGKTHQLRLHMLNIGMPILNDNFYPQLLPQRAESDFEKPLQLLAKKLRFVDPIDNQHYEFESPRNLECWSLTKWSKNESI